MSQLQVTGEAKIRDIQGPVVANSGVITALDGAANQYVRGDGTLASFPTSGGGGSSVSYYLNGSVNQGTFGGSTYYQMSKNAIVGTGTNFSASANGLIAQFITDANDPDVVSIPSGNWNVEFFMNVSASSGALASFYVEFYKYNGSTFTLLATNVATPEQLTNTTTVDAYYTSVAMPLSTMAVTDRLAIRIFVNVAGKTVTLYTEDNRLCQVVTTFSKGLASLNNLTDQSQYLTTGTSGTNFNIVSSGDTHTFNLPVASATNTGKLSSTDWSTFNNKVPYTGATASVDLGVYALSSSVLYADGLGSIAGFLYLKQNTTTSQYLADYSAIGAYSNGYVFNIATPSVSKQALLDLSLITASASRTFTLPDLSGTLALTSDLNGYVPYNGATTGLDLGIYSYNGNSVLINGNGTTQNGTLLFKQGGALAFNTTGYSGIGILGTTSMHFNFNQSSGVYKRFNFNVLGLTNNTLRTLNIPDATGTIALTSDLSDFVTLSTYQTITANKTFSGWIQANTLFLSNSSSVSSATGFGTLTYNKSGSVSTLRITNDNNATASLIFDNTTNYNYTFPAATGTLALTSDLGGYVTLATTQTISGAKTFSSLLTLNNKLYLQTDPLNSTGVYLQSYNSNELSIGVTSLGTTYYSDFIFQNTSRYYTFPNADGTLALTSDLSSYLPLSGGTLTGALSGTSATFSTFLGVGGNQQRDPSGSRSLTISGVSSGFAASLDLYATRSYAIYTGGSGSLGFYDLTASVERLTISSTGAATFSSSVTANGTITVNEDGAGTKVLTLRSNWAGVDPAINVTTNNSLLLMTNNTERMRITSGGNVGIGTSSPNAQLDVATTARFHSSSNWMQFQQNVLTSQNNDGAHIRSVVSADSAPTYSWAGDTDTGMYTPAANTIAFSTGAVERMRITSGGNVGIGTITTDGKLHVNAGTGQNFVVAGDGTNICSINNYSSASGFRELKIVGSPLTFYTGNAGEGSVTERMRITSGGNLLIGKSTTGVDTNGFRFDSNGVLFTSVPTGESTYYLRDTTNAVYRFYVTSGGTINATNTTISAISDVRLKENITDLQIGLDAIMALRPRQFDWKKESGNSGKNVRGFIAQEFEEVFPDLIDESINKTPEGEPYKQIRQDLIPILVKAIQELKAEIDELKNK